MRMVFADCIKSVMQLIKHVSHLRVPHRLSRFIGKQILFRDIRDIFGFRILREQVVEWLVFAGPDLFRNGLPPFFRIREYGIDIKNHTPERKQPVAYHLPNSEFGLLFILHVCIITPLHWGFKTPKYAPIKIAIQTFPYGALHESQH